MKLGNTHIIKFTKKDIKNVYLQSHRWDTWVELTLDSGSIAFQHIIRDTGPSGSTELRMQPGKPYGSSGVSGPTFEIREPEANRGWQLSPTVVHSFPIRFGIGVTSPTRYYGTETFSEHDLPKATMHIRKAGPYQLETNTTTGHPMMILEASSSTATTADNFITFRTINTYGSDPDIRSDWHIGTDGSADMFVISSGSGNNPHPNFPVNINSQPTQIVTVTGQTNAGSGTGRVGIADSSPDYPLDVAGYDASNITIYAQRDIAAYSDVRSKTDILTISGSLDTICNIRGITYRNIGDDGLGTGNRMMGVIAQELEPYLPEIVSTDKKGFKSVKYANLTALLIQAVKEQQEQIEELKQEIKEIKDAVSS